jgi:hypothetical protein
LPLQNEGDQSAQHQEHQHPEEKDAGRWEPGQIGTIRHRL